MKKDLIEKEEIHHEPERGEGVIKDKNIYATYPHKCEKCGYDKAEVIDEGVKYTDEAGVILLECGKCGWSERVNKKTS